MIAMPRARWDVKGGICETDDGKGSNVLGAPEEWVELPECGVEVAAGSLMTHRQNQHGVGRGDREGAPPHPPGRPRLTGYPSQKTCRGSDAR